MNLLVALLMVTMPLKEPHVYYYNGKNIVSLNVVEMPNARRAVLQFFVHSPYELRNACVDSSDVEMCLPGISLRDKLELKGRWYIISWDARLSVGSSRHVIHLYSCHHKVYDKAFHIDVEGSKRIEKPQGVN